MKKISLHFSVLSFSTTMAILLLSFSSLSTASSVDPSPISDEFVYSESVSNQGPSELSMGSYPQQIKDIARASSCSRYSWLGRGRAPAGYIKGMALSFARSHCRLIESNPPSILAAILGAADKHNPRTDAISYYQRTFAAQNMNTQMAGEETLRALYTLGMGLGMRESAGTYCTGWDNSLGGNRPSATIEAGLFQTSFNSMSASRELSKLYAEYLSSPSRCYSETFKEGTRCSPQKIVAESAGGAYQAFTRSCPAFATEYAMTLLRILRTHFGPINRKEAQVVPACNMMLNNVQQLIDKDPQSACQDLL